MAYSTCTRGAGSLIGSKFLRLSTSTPPSLQTVPFSFHISAKSHGFAAATATASRQHELALAEAPSCIFVGPLETASQETLEALYTQARDAYYSGKPLIVDDMFDRVELKLRRYGSKSVVKYPRCSLRRLATYADAEDLAPLNKDLHVGSFILGIHGQADLSQAFALASIWILFLAVGSSACLVPIIYIFSLAFHDAFGSELLYSTQLFPLGYITMFNGFLFAVLGSIIGYPIVTASVGVLRGLWRNDLVALRGACPNCGEEVFAFVRSDQSNSSPHRADCHVCECSLVFRTKAEKSVSKLGRRWVYGRIYLVSQRGRSQRWV